MQAAQKLRKQLVDTARQLHARGWVANHDGNITVRLGPDRFLATPTATSKAAVQESLLLEVDRAGKRLSGTSKPFGELGLHMAIYERRPDVHAVVHAHPPHATAIACSTGNPIERPFIAEAVVSLGPTIPKLPFAAPGADAARALAAVAESVDAALLGNHGVIAWGADVEQAYLRLELVEHLARIALLALPMGGVQPLPASALAPLLAARAKAGLGKAAEAAAKLAAAAVPPSAAAPAPAAPAASAASGPALVQAIAARPAYGSPGSPRPQESRGSQGTPGSGDLARIIREELQRVLDDRD